MEKTNGRVVIPVPSILLNCVKKEARCKSLFLKKIFKKFKRLLKVKKNKAGRDVEATKDSIS